MNTICVCWFGLSHQLSGQPRTEAAPQPMWLHWMMSLGWLMAGDHIRNEIAKRFVAWARGSEFASEIESEV